jgi:hypothetical protein
MYRIYTRSHLFEENEVAILESYQNLRGNIESFIEAIRARDFVKVRIMIEEARDARLSLNEESQQ